MPLFKVTIEGRGLWISINDEVLRMAFVVDRVVDATNRGEAGNQALALIREDSKAKPLPGTPPPRLSVVRTSAAARMPTVQPGFKFGQDQGD